MPYTARTLITKAYYLSQVVSRDFQVTQGSEIQDGLDLLNDLLDIKESDLRLIPYWTRYEFPTVIGQESYFIPNLLAVDTITFNIGVVRYAMIDLKRRDYFGTARVDNINSLPFQYHVERGFGGATIYFYFFPAAAYDVKLSGKFGFSEVTLDTDLSLTYDRYYIEYLRYALAEYICCDFGQTFPDQCAAKYKEIRKKLMDISPADLTVRKRSYFDSNFGWDWQSINLTQGYWP
jgi:hypothetical protein